MTYSILQSRLPYCRKFMPGVKICVCPSTVKDLAWDQALYWGKKGKKSPSEASREVVWGRERMAEPGDMPLMPPIRPPATNLSLKCQHINF